LLGHLGVLLATDPSGTPYLLGMAGGFAIGAIGHLFALPSVVLLGIVVVFVTLALFVIATDPTSGPY
jgi:hypothetical protein